MLSLFKQFLTGQRGQALPLVLCLLAIGGLTIAVSLNFATTSLRGSQIIREDLHGAYAANAGLEHAMWSLANNQAALTQLPETINGMTVNIEVVDRGNYTLYFGELISAGGHADYLDVDSEIIDEGGGIYRFTITITWQPEQGTPVIKLLQVGTRIPPGYSYLADSTANFTENLSTDEPDITQDGQDTYLLNWNLSPPRPDLSEINPVETQKFYITGSDIQTAKYAWVIAQDPDIGELGEITGTLYEITATANRPVDGRAANRTKADIIVEVSGLIHIVSWQYLN